MSGSSLGEAALDKAHLKDPGFWLHYFVTDPLGAATHLYGALAAHGYFDVTALWRQFYDSSVTEDHLRWYNIALYIAGCFIFLAVTRALGEVGARGFVSYLIPEHVRKSKSFRVDLQWFAVGLIKLPTLVGDVIATLLFLHAVPLVIAHWNIHFLNNEVDKLSPSLRALVIFLTALICYDFGYYWAHRVLHMRLFWQFHKVHHYSEQLNMLIGARFHPVNSLLTGTFGTFAMAVGVSLVTNYTGFGLVADLNGMASAYWWFWPVVAIPTFGGRFVHSHVPITYGWLDYIFVSPAMHIVHHARNPDLHDLNFGQVISFWDWLFGTMHLHDYSKPFELGITEFGDDHYRNVWHAFIEPFGDAFQVLKSAFSHRVEERRIA